MRFTSILPDAPEVTARSASLLILSTCLVVALIWSVVIYSQDDKGVLTRAADAYWSEQYSEAAHLYDEVTQYAREDTSLLVVRLREQATIYGHQERYGEQKETMQEALQLARAADLDSLEQEAATSLGYISAFCARDSVQCGPKSALAVSLARSEYSAPMGIVLLGLISIAVIFLVYPPDGDRRGKEVDASE